jgi:hypothetical protein
MVEHNRILASLLFRKPLFLTMNGFFTSKVSDMCPKFWCEKVIAP